MFLINTGLIDFLFLCEIILHNGLYKSNSIVSTGLLYTPVTL